MIDFAAVQARLVERLEAVADEILEDGTTRRFGAVVPRDFFEPPLRSFVCLYYDGEQEEEETLANVMTRHRWVVAAKWQLQSALSAANDFEIEKAESLRALKRELRGNSNLDGTVTDLKLGLAQYSREANEAGDRWAVMRFNVDVWDLEGEEIAP
jgi:hypothetical protein